MKEDLRKQIKLDDADQICELEADLNLSTKRILDKFHSKVQHEQRRRMKIKMISLGMAACITLLIGINWNAIYTFAYELFADNKVVIEGKVVTDTNMKMIDVNKPDHFDSEGIYGAEKYYSSLKECTDALGITILTSDLAWNESYDKKVTLSYPKDINLTTICDSNYIIGDLKDFRRDENGGGVYYKTSTENEKYKTPVDLRLDFFISGTPKQSPGMDNTYLNSHDVETYISPNGIEATILKGAGTEAYFYHENIKYTLTGNVELSELKRIIDSFH